MEYFLHYHRLIVCMYTTTRLTSPLTIWEGIFQKIKNVKIVHRISICWGGSYSVLKMVSSSNNRMILVGSQSPPCFNRLLTKMVNCKPLFEFYGVQKTLFIHWNKLYAVWKIGIFDLCFINKGFLEYIKKRVYLNGSCSKDSWPLKGIDIFMKLSR